MQLGAKLRLLRKKNGYTLVDVGKGTGLSVSFLSDMERGRANPSLDTLEKLAAFYELSSNELLDSVDIDVTPAEAPYPEGFAEFLKEVEEIDEELMELLFTVERRAQHRARTKEEWKRYYYSLKTLLGK